MVGCGRQPWDASRGRSAVGHGNLNHGARSWCRVVGTGLGPVTPAAAGAWAVACVRDVKKRRSVDVCSQLSGRGCEGVRCVCVRAWEDGGCYSNITAVWYTLSSVCVAFAFSRVGRPAPGLGLLRDFFTVVYTCCNYHYCTHTGPMMHDVRFTASARSSGLWLPSPLPPALLRTPLPLGPWCAQLARRGDGHDDAIQEPLRSGLRTTQVPAGWFRNR